VFSSPFFKIFETLAYAEKEFQAPDQKTVNLAKRANFSGEEMNTTHWKFFDVGWPHESEFRI
jgi:hypothetical protein